MLRGEAIQVLRDIIKFFAANSLFISSICLIAPSNDNGLMGYQLNIGVRLDDASTKGLMPLLKEKCLEKEKNEDHILIFKCQQP